MTGTTSLTAGIELPDGRAVSVAITIPAGDPSAGVVRELADYAEIAQMTAAHALTVITRSDESRARRAAEDEEVSF